MKRISNIMVGIFSMMLFGFFNVVNAQVNEVYRNELIGVIIRYEGSGGGYDWAFVKALPSHVVSFDYKGTRVTLKGLTGHRFIRKDYPSPRGFKLADSQVIVDGFPATNYNDYMRYYNSLYQDINQIGKGAREDKQKLQEAIKIIDYKIAEISQQSTRFQVSPEFRKQHSLEKYIESLKVKRKSFEDDIAQVDKKNESSNIVITGADSEGNVQGKNDIDETNTNAANADFWGDGSSTVDDNQQRTGVAGHRPERNDDNVRGASTFAGGLGDIKEGEYFVDDKGNHYQKRQGKAYKVDKATFDRHQANKIYKQMERQEAERQQRDVEFRQKWDEVNTSFYMMSAAKHGLRDAGHLEGRFESIEELYAAFRQQMREISVRAGELQQSSTLGAQAYAQVIATGSSGYDYSGMTSAIGGIAAAISANKAEKEARDDLKRQRDHAEAEIKTRQLKAIVDMRSEISKVFLEGGMPLSSHKVTAPVLYLFAYSSNKSEWGKNQTVTMGISNVIPVYRYSDGTYPYSANVKRTFENAGMINPIIIGFFTDRKDAENYRSSLVEIAPDAKFAIKDIEVQVRDLPINALDNSRSEVDFWGTKRNGNTGDKSVPTKAKEKKVDFWGTPGEDNSSKKTNVEIEKAGTNKNMQNM